MTNKYLNHKVKDYSGGQDFDSRLEHSRYLFLQNEQRLGRIQNLERQKVYELIPTQTETIARYGKKGQALKPETRVVERACTYAADFYYEKIEHKPFSEALIDALETGKGETDTIIPVVEDCKAAGGFTKTKEYVIKRKLMLYIHKIRIKEVTHATDRI